MSTRLRDQMRPLAPLASRAYVPLASRAACLDGRDHLVGAFSAADILTTRILRHTDLLEEQPVLVAYEQRCKARPAFATALADQMAAFGA